MIAKLRLYGAALEREARGRLLTCDGRGVAIKTALLDELIRRWTAAKEK